MYMSVVKFPAYNMHCAGETRDSLIADVISRYLSKDQKVFTYF